MLSLCQNAVLAAINAGVNRQAVEAFGSQTGTLARWLARFPGQEQVMIEFEAQRLRDACHVFTSRREKLDSRRLRRFQQGKGEWETR